MSIDGRRLKRVTITSTANPRIRDLIALRRRRVREGHRVTAVEGYDELSVAVRAGVRPTALYYCPELVTGAAELGMVETLAAGGVEIVAVSRTVFGKIAYRESPDGWLALVPAIENEVDRLQLGENPVILVVEGVEKPGNLGAMLRTADAAGLAAMVAADPVTDWGNPNLVRASKGTVFSVPIASGTSDEVLGWLRRNSVRIVATAPDTETSYVDADLTGPVAIVVGTERSGLTGRWLQAADARVRIPMVGTVNSLNVATSAAIVVYEAVRQRARGH